MTLITRNRLQLYIALMRLNQPIGIWLLLWPTLWGLWLSSYGIPVSKTLFIFILGTIVMRSAGCIMNDIIDCDLDLQVKRTQHRPLATRNLSRTEAFILFGLLMTSAFFLVLQFNSLTLLLAGIGVIFTLCYPWLKRFTHLPQCGLSLAFMWGIPMAFAACQNTVPIKAWFLFASGGLWVIIYDTIYALADRADDLKAGIKSTAILFNAADRSIIGCLQIIFIGLLALIGPLFQLSIVYYSCLPLIALLFAYQQFLIQQRNTQAYIRAFKNNQWVGCIIFGAIVIHYQLMA